MTRVRWRNSVRDLLHGGERAGTLTHAAHGVAVNSPQPGDGLGLAGSMNGVGVGELVCIGPYGEVGAVGHQWSGWRPEGLLLGEKEWTEQRVRSFEKLECSTNSNIAA